jgi:hypothetical protein
VDDVMRGGIPWICDGDGDVDDKSSIIAGMVTDGMIDSYLLRLRSKAVVCPVGE